MDGIELSAVYIQICPEYHIGYRGIVYPKVFLADIINHCAICCPI